MLADVRRRSRKIRRAAAVADFGGWSLAVFAALSLAFGLFGDIPSLLAAVALAVTATNEFRGAARLKRFDPSAARLLGYNQVALGALIVAYAGWMMTRPPVSSEVLDALGPDGAPLARTVQRLFYGVVAASGILVPGLTALYYFSRGPIVRRFRESTPPWVLDALNAAQ